MYMQVFPKYQLCTGLGTSISECQVNDEQIILMGNWDSEASEVDIWMTDHGLIN